MTALKIAAGFTAYKHIQQYGLSPEHVSAIFGASGAAKWLTIYGLDKAIFSDWLIDSHHPIDLFGTSVGAFKLAAAAQLNPADALSVLADAYIDQRYEDKITAQQVTFETTKILNAFLTEKAISDILSNKRFNYHCASVRCLGLFASKNNTLQKLAMIKAFFLSSLGRNFLSGTFERTIFSQGISASELVGADGYLTHSVTLTKHNMRNAILSSGSIPVIMAGVENIPGAPAGMYRDGGLLDYHAVPANVGHINRGLVLYPHFYTSLKAGWFDKFFPWRKVSAEQLDNTVVISPSDEFVKSLPAERIPDRQDFLRFKGNDQQRIRNWSEVKKRSIELGDEFLQLAQSGDIASKVERLM
jgi:hypothetical protein